MATGLTSEEDLSDGPSGREAGAFIHRLPTPLVGGVPLGVLIPLPSDFS